MTATNVSPTNSQPTSSAWAVTEFIPDDTPEHEGEQESVITHGHHDYNALEKIYMAWSNQTLTPSSPMLLGHMDKFKIIS